MIGHKEAIHLGVSNKGSSSKRERREGARGRTLSHSVFAIKIREASRHDHKRSTEGCMAKSVVGREHPGQHCRAGPIQEAGEETRIL